MISFLKLIRLPNLIIIALTQYAMRWGIIYPMLQTLNKYLHATFPQQITNPEILKLQMSEVQFFLLVLSTVMMAAAGYIINDYFDVKIDRINKPDRMVIDKGIKRRVAMGAHIVISVIAIIIGSSLAYVNGMLKLSIIYFIASGMLWYYSTTFKKQFLIGNLAIALLTGLVPIMVGLFEIPLLSQKYAILTTEPFHINFHIIFKFITGFSFFAFIVTIVREILKDMEDYEGDKEYDCNTLPIALSISKAKYIVSGIIIITMSIIGYIQYSHYAAQAYLSFYYLMLCIQIPFLLLIFKTLTGKEPKDFRYPEILTKVIMVLGILYATVIYYNFGM